jgi:hypothetical protein
VWLYSGGVDLAPMGYIPAQSVPLGGAVAYEGGRIYQVRQELGKTTWFPVPYEVELFRVPVNGEQLRVGRTLEVQFGLVLQMLADTDAQWRIVVDAANLAQVNDPAEQGLNPRPAVDGAQQVEVEIEETADPRFDEAVHAVSAGDWNLAKKAYQGILDSDPGDLDAQGGLIMAGIFERTDGVEPPLGDSFDELLIVADLAAANGEWDNAFAAAIKGVQLSSGAERELARTRLVEYFVLAGDDPSVPGARIALANALF